MKKDLKSILKANKILVIIPAYNEALNILKVVGDLKENAPENTEYIIINDGSTDNTMELVREHNLKCIDMIQNVGLFGAVQTGFQYADKHDYDVAIQFDGDGQHEARYLYKLIDEIKAGSDIVIGSRFIDEPKPWTARMMGSRLISLAIFLVTGKKFKDPTSGLRAYDATVIADYAHELNNPPEPDTLVYMIKKKMKIAEVQVEMSDREFGESYLNLSNTIKYMSRMLISVLLIQPFRKVK